MTRLGWLVVPEALVGAVDKLAQDLDIRAASVAQHAALAEYERRREVLRSRRNFIVPALERFGLPIPPPTASG